jgi:RNA polymerase sigma-70 factor (ECF subfamily)
MAGQTPAAGYYLNESGGSVWGPTLRETRSVYDRSLVELASNPRAYLVAYRITGDRALSEDAVQEAFCQMLRQPPARQHRDELLAYFLNAVRGHALDVVRSKAKRKRRESVYGRVTERRSIRTDERLRQHELSHAVREAIEELPRKEREAVSLRYEQGLSDRKAAAILEIPPSTLNLRVHRALKRMRVRLTAGGHAVATPVVLARQVSELGVPPQPEALRKTLLDLLANGPPPGARHVRGGGISKKAFAGTRAGGAGTFAVVGLVIAGFSALWTQGESGGTCRASKLFEAEAPERREAGAATARPEGSGYVDGRVLFRDDFEQGLGKWKCEIRGNSGRAWEPYAPGPDAAISTMPRDNTVDQGAVLAMVPAGLGPHGAVKNTVRGFGVGQSYVCDYDVLFPSEKGKRPMVPDRMVPSLKYEPDRWYHVRRERVRMAGGRWRERVFVDGRFGGARSGYRDDDSRFAFWTVNDAYSYRRLDNLVLRELVRIEK